VKNAHFQWNILKQNDLNFQSPALAGIDEAGRGPIAGPVVAAAVSLDYRVDLPGLDDSKRLTVRQRERLFQFIICSANDWAIVAVSCREIDRINILQATFNAMRLACHALNEKPFLVLIDGNHTIPELKYKQQSIIKGDTSSAAIAAASVLAKVSRDRIMERYHHIYPGYGFAQHKGYPTRSHLESLISLGACPIHRQTFSPLNSMAQKQLALFEL